MDQKKKKLTLSNETTPSNPGKIKFNPLNWIKYDTKKALLLTVSLLLSMLLTLKVSYFFAILFLVLLIINAYYWISKKEHFGADSNPGVIISTEPPLAAVYTNLAKYGDDFPAIKIIEYKVKKLINIGDIIATVAVYSAMDGDDEHDYGYWEDFFPLPTEYATDNISEINTEINSYQKDDLDALNEGLYEINQPYKLGLFRINLNNSDWKNT